MLKIAHDPAVGKPAEPEELVIDLDELCRIAATQMLALALETERRAYLEAHADVVDASGMRMVVGNGHARAREVMTGAGMVEVAAPRVDDRRDGERFSSAILPPYMRRSPKVTEVLPILYLRGLSTSDFAPALFRRSSAPTPACPPPPSAVSPSPGRPSTSGGRGAA